jgi:exopolysaccharide biosynthesis polyprenyl glycosylphosphotransferase
VASVVVTEAPGRAVLSRTARFRHDALRRRALAFADVAAVLTATGAVVAISDDRTAALRILLFVPIWITLAKMCGLYDNDHRTLRPLTVDEVPRIVLWSLLGSAMLTVANTALGFNVFAPTSRITLWAVLASSAFLFRAIARMSWRYTTPRERVIVVGNGELADAVKRKFHLFPDMHVELVAEHVAIDPEALRRGYLEGFDQAARIVVASETISEDVLVDLLAYCRRHQIKLSVVPPARGMFGTAVQLSHVADLPVIHYHTWDISRTSLLAKRAVDVVLSMSALVALAPIMLTIAISNRLSHEGPVLFRQVRAGKGGQPFTMLKFRTMATDAEHRLCEVVDVDTLEHPVFKLANDPRVTRFGRVLRRWSLDELPQLVNVLRGEMSLVGPRPEQVEIVERYEPEHRFRLMVKPGMTGPMQVFGRGALSFEERLSVERDYVENFSMARDIQLMGLTIAAVFRRWGAY